MNTTFTNPACVCASENVSGSGFDSPKGQQTAVDQLAQKAANWAALEPVQPPPIGNPNPDEMLRVDSPRHDWPVYLVNVPDDWEPESWRSVPPHTTTYKKAKTAAEIAAVLNREYIERSKDGLVSHWYIRVRVSSRYANLSVALPTRWKPENEFDLPPAFIRIDGPRQQCQQIVGDLNSRLDQVGPGEIRKRAYIARSICPGDVQPWASRDDSQSSETELDPAGPQTAKAGHSAPLNQTARNPEEMEAQLVDSEEDETELIEIQMGHHFGTNPTICEDVILHVQNASNSEEARRKADLFLMESAIDMSQRIALNGFSEADNDGNEYKVVLTDGTLLRFRLSRSEALNLISAWNQSRKHSEPEAVIVQR
ncbi:hypothetical protein FYZ48_28635 [Gimesia chilikensis]|uniref:hypothetical protein n=1 Tax=Gimesia chilikensis TaxID=2605989 RepID=UPI0011F0337F|nr:hypothetical protein [Gimesia chilikensis]KAA0132085.1 hypothetical protein FYZ48_28635 [Gimesia chilikensis]